MVMIHKITCEPHNMYLNPTLRNRNHRAKLQTGFQGAVTSLSWVLPLLQLLAWMPVSEIWHFCISLPEFLIMPSVGTLFSCGFDVAALCKVAVDIFYHVNMLFYWCGLVFGVDWFYWKGWFFEESEMATVTTSSALIAWLILSLKYAIELLFRLLQSLTFQWHSRACKCKFKYLESSSALQTLCCWVQACYFSPKSAVTIRLYKLFL